MLGKGPLLPSVPRCRLALTCLKLGQSRPRTKQVEVGTLCFHFYTKCFTGVFFFFSLVKLDPDTYSGNACTYFSKNRELRGGPTSRPLSPSRG